MAQHSIDCNNSGISCDQISSYSISNQTTNSFDISWTAGSNYTSVILANMANTNVQTFNGVGPTLTIPYPITDFDNITFDVRCKDGSVKTNTFSLNCDKPTITGTPVITSVYASGPDEWTHTIPLAWAGPLGANYRVVISDGTSSTQITNTVATSGIFEMTCTNVPTAVCAHTGSSDFDAGIISINNGTNLTVTVFNVCANGVLTASDSKSINVVFPPSCSAHTFTLTNATSDGFDINITNFLGGDNWQYSLDNGATWSSTISVANTTLTGLSQNTQYDVLVKRICIGGYDNVVGPQSITTIAAPVCNPYAFTITNITDTTFDINITSFVPGDTWDLLLNGSISVITNHNSGTYTVTSLTPGTPYTIEITRDCALGGTAISNGSTTTTNSSSGLCNTPYIFTVSDIHETSFIVNIGAFVAGTTWTVLINGVPYTGANNLTGTSHTITGLTKGTAYTVNVRKVCSPTNSIDGTPQNITTRSYCVVVTGYTKDGSTVNSFSNPSWTIGTNVVISHIIDTITNSVIFPNVIVYGVHSDGHTQPWGGIPVASPWTDSGNVSYHPANSPLTPSIVGNTSPILPKGCPFPYQTHKYENNTAGVISVTGRNQIGQIHTYNVGIGSQVLIHITSGGVGLTDLGPSNTF